jgi:CheY-like chemotaxis protein
MKVAQASVLVVDDDTISRALLVRGLELAGHRVAVADNGRQALEFLRADRVGCISSVPRRCAGARP